MNSYRNVMPLFWVTIHYYFKTLFLWKLFKKSRAHALFVTILCTSRADWVTSKSNRQRLVRQRTLDRITSCTMSSPQATNLLTVANTSLIVAIILLIVTLQIFDQISTVIIWSWCRGRTCCAGNRKYKVWAKPVASNKQAIPNPTHLNPIYDSRSKMLKTSTCKIAINYIATSSSLSLQVSNTSKHFNTARASRK